MIEPLTETLSMNMNEGLIVSASLILMFFITIYVIRLLYLYESKKIWLKYLEKNGKKIY